jgi:hypothetical protein
MEPLEELRAKIPGFPGYGDELELRRSDEYVRSYLGEALADFAQRCPLAPDLRQRVDALILRVGFSDPRDFATHHVVSQQHDAQDDGAVAAADAATVELADRAGSIDAASAARFLDEVAAVLDARQAAIRAAELKTP